MSELMEEMDKLVSIENSSDKQIGDKEIYYQSENVVEALCKSTAKEIEEMSLEFEKKSGKYYVVPLWLRILLYRMLLLHKPNDLNIRKRCVKMINSYGDPWWDEEVKKW